jgi:predicted RND superfamily exporter protein
VEALVAALEGIARAAIRERPQVTAEILDLQERLERLLAGLSEDGLGQRLVVYEETLCGQLAELLETLATECGTEAILDAELPKEIRERFVGRTGAYLIRVYPKENIWDEAPLAAFVADLKSVVSDVGGVPVQFYESDRLIRRGYARSARIALVLVVFYLVLHFRGVLLPLVATATLLVGASWGVGLLALLEIEVNPANLLALPLTLGIGIDYAIHMVQRDREARQAPSLGGAPAVLATSTGRSVLLSAATTVVGFGALCLSSHRGIASIGWTLCLAVGASLVSALLFCPALLRLLAGPSEPLTLRGRPGPKTGPGGNYVGQDPDGSSR